MAVGVPPRSPILVMRPVWSAAVVLTWALVPVPLVVLTSEALPEFPTM